jgi:hypothetical protein
MHRPRVFIERKRRQTAVRLSAADAGDWEGAKKLLTVFGVFGGVMLVGFVYLGMREGFTA